MAKVKAEASIALSKIGQCGFYQRGEDLPAFGSTDEMLSMLEFWSSGKSMTLTKIFDPEASDHEMPTYLLGILKSGNDWIVAIWNELQSTDGGVASVSNDSIVGRPQVHTNTIVPNSIPGYATYFWLLPQESLMASIRFQHRTTGLQAFQKYAERFLGAYSKHVVREMEDGVKKITGYTIDGKGPATNSLQARFRVLANMKSSELDKLRESVDSIVRVLRRGHLQGTKAEDQTTFATFVQFVRGTGKKVAMLKPKHVSLELDYTPSLDELNGMIESEEQDLGVSAWDDLGFKLKGEAKIIWVRNSRARGKFLFDVDRLDAEMIDLQSLARALAADKRKILGLLQPKCGE